MRVKSWEQVSPTLNDTVLGYAQFNDSSNYSPVDVRLNNEGGYEEDEYY